MRSLLIGIAVVAVFFVGRYLYMKPKFMIGTNAPSFVAEIKDGTTFNLEETWKENVILLDFWGSWCGPCRKENPNLVKLYKEFHNKSFEGFDNFEIVSVAIETKEEPWIRAIEQDTLNWPLHIVQLDRFSSPIAKLYGVNEIPTSYLINTKGQIVGVNMTYEDCRAYLKQKLTNI